MLSPSRPLKSVLSKVKRQSELVDKAVMTTGRKELRGHVGKVTWGQGEETYNAPKLAMGVLRGVL